MKKIIWYSLLISSIGISNGCRMIPSPPPLATYSGSFRSVQGVKDPLSCYCANGGYLTITSGERIPICLKEEATVTCTSLQVTGSFTQRAAPSEPTTPCPLDSKRVLLVQKLECL